jgi:hypothetical protein
LQPSIDPLCPWIDQAWDSVVVDDLMFTASFMGWVCVMNLTDFSNGHNIGEKLLMGHNINGIAYDAKCVLAICSATLSVASNKSFGATCFSSTLSFRIGYAPKNRSCQPTLRNT